MNKAESLKSEILKLIRTMDTLQQLEVSEKLLDLIEEEIMFRQIEIEAEKE